MNWLTQTHPDYPTIAAREKYAWDHYTGEALDIARAKAEGLGGSYVEHSMGLDELLRKGAPSAPYLLRRSQGESVAAYKERLMISRYPRHMSKIMGTIVGGIAIVEDKAKRTWGEGLGDPKTPGTFMHRFVLDTDGAGTNYSTLLIKALTSLVVSHRLWYVVEPGPTPRIILLDTAEVDNWLRQNNRLSEVKVREVVDTRSSLKQESESPMAHRWVYYDTAGFSRWREDKDGPVNVSSQDWKYPFKTDKGELRLPLNCVKVPLKMDAGYRVAQSCNSLFNLLSDARNLLRVANHPRLRGQGITKDEFEAVTTEIQKGQNTLLGDWDFIGPDPSNARTGFEMYKEEVREVYVEAFQIYEEAAQVERTATEVGVEETKGRRSILTVLADTLDEFENDVLFLLEQTQHPTNEALWRTSSVTRSRDFKPLDPEQTADRIMQYIFPGGIAMPAPVEAEFVKRVADGYGIDGFDAEIEAVAGEQALVTAQERAEELELNGLPA